MAAVSDATVLIYIACFLLNKWLNVYWMVTSNSYHSISRCTLMHLVDISIVLLSGFARSSQCSVNSSLLTI